MTHRRIRVIYNPTARSGRAAGLIDQLRGDGQIEWIESRSPAHLTQLVRQGQLAELDVLALAGGDGTVRLALAALEQPNRVPIGLLPFGSGNDFARDLGIPAEPDAALELLRCGTPRWVDVAQLTDDPERYCCVASIGFDSHALRIIHSSWLPRSRLLNLYATVRALWSAKPCWVRVSWKGGCFQGQAMLIAVTNTRGYGGGFLLSPKARIDDGQLDLCLIKRCSRLSLLRQLGRIFSQGPTREVIQASSPWVRIESLQRRLPVALDGELPSHHTPIELHCRHHALQVVTP